MATSNYEWNVTTCVEVEYVDPNYPDEPQIGWAVHGEKAKKDAAAALLARANVSSTGINIFLFFAHKRNEDGSIKENLQQEFKQLVDAGHFKKFWAQEVIVKTDPYKRYWSADVGQNKAGDEVCDAFGKPIIYTDVKVACLCDPETGELQEDAKRKARSWISRGVKSKTVELVSLGETSDEAGFDPPKSQPFDEAALRTKAKVVADAMGTSEEEAYNDLVAKVTGQPAKVDRQ